MTRGVVGQEGTHQRIRKSQAFWSGRQSGPAHLRRRSRLHRHFAILHVDGPQQRLYHRGVLRGCGPSARCCSASPCFTPPAGLAVHDRARAPADQAQLRSARQGSGLTQHELIHVRDNSEAIMQARDEESQTARLLTRLDDLVANFGEITSINRNVGFFTTGYDWLIQ